jgi:hypothetical protein
MHVVSGTMGNETVHYTAPPATILEEEMNRFFGCCRGSTAGNTEDGRTDHILENRE